MKLLISTQAMDTQNPALGFFHDWVAALAPYFDEVHVICLFEGSHQLPVNVSVYSLGKEMHTGPERGGYSRRIRYAVRFLHIAWKLRASYDRVLVHMNEEYVLIAGLLWKLLGKPIYMWRNHYAGSWRTDTATALCTKVFCTSQHSYTAKYPKTVFMPVGIDMRRFVGSVAPLRDERSILFLARMGPAKRPHVLIEALGLLSKKGISFSASFVGTPLPEHEAYYQELIRAAETYGLSTQVAFRTAVPNSETPREYRTHEYFVNASPSGMFDKTLFEAAACGALVVAASADFEILAGKQSHFDGSAEGLAETLQGLMEMSGDEKAALRKRLGAIAEANSLERLAVELAAQLR